MKNCWAMSRDGGESCQVCGCSWELHMHVTYELVPVTKQGEDEGAKKRYKVPPESTF